MNMNINHATIHVTIDKIKEDYKNGLLTKQQTKERLEGVLLTVKYSEGPFNRSLNEFASQKAKEVIDNFNRY